MKPCDENSENQQWNFRDSGLIQHRKLNICVDSRWAQEKGISAERCNSASPSQQWKILYYETPVNNIQL